MIKSKKRDTLAAMKLLLLGFCTSGGNCVEMGRESEGLLCS